MRIHDKSMKAHHNLLFLVKTQQRFRPKDWTIVNAFKEEKIASNPNYPASSCDRYPFMAYQPVSVFRPSGSLALVSCSLLPRLSMVSCWLGKVDRILPRFWIIRNPAPRR